MKKNWLILGCSNAFTIHKFFESYWPDKTFVNLSLSGAGNAYIYDSLFNYLNENDSPEFVYLQFSGLYRIDLWIDGSEKMFSSGGLNGSWLYSGRDTVNFFKRFLLEENLHKIKQNSIKECFNCISLLEYLKIPYVYTWYYDIFNCITPKISDEGFITQLPDCFPKKTFLNSFPHTYAYDTNQLLEDGCHFTGFPEWLETQISKFPIKSDIRFF